MTKPFWRKIDIVQVSAAPTECRWNLVIDRAYGPRLLKFTIVNRNNAGAGRY